MVGLPDETCWVIFLSMSVLGPVKFDIPAGAQPLIKFARMLLDVADVDELQFQFINIKPVEARFRLEVGDGDAPANLLLDKSQILEDFLFRERSTANGFAVFSPTDKILPGGLQIQVGIVKRMIGFKPEFILILWGVPHSSRAFNDRLF